MQWLWMWMWISSLRLGMGGQIGLDILCAPPYARPGETFHINVMYAINEPTQADLHFDLVDEAVKEWVAGTAIALPSSTGRLSIPMTLPAEDRLPQTYIWKVYISPHGEVFPNMMIEKGLAITIEDQETLPCPMLVPSVSVPPADDETDYLVIDRLQSHILVWGQEEKCSLSMDLKYRLRSRDHAIISVVLMDATTNEIYFPGSIHPVHRGEAVLGMNLSAVPTSERPLLYVETTLLPTGYSPWTLRLAEDRRYKNVCAIRL